MKRRTLPFLGVVVGLLLAQDTSGSGPSKDTLDLPYSFAGLTGEDEEAPEVIFFHGQPYRGDGFVFVGGGTA